MTAPVPTLWPTTAAESTTAATGAPPSHLSDPTDAHAASAVSFTSAGLLVVTGDDVQEALGVVDESLDLLATGVSGNADSIGVLSSNDTALDGRLTTAEADIDALEAADVGASTRLDTIEGKLAGAPAALDTLDELAAALGDDANYAATVTNSLASASAERSSLDTLLWMGA